jgi:hypothetical protein
LEKLGGKPLKTGLARPFFMPIAEAFQLSRRPDFSLFLLSFFCNIRLDAKTFFSISSPDIKTSVAKTETSFKGAAKRNQMQN